LGPLNERGPKTVMIGELFGPSISHPKFRLLAHKKTDRHLYRYPWLPEGLHYTPTCRILRISTTEERTMERMPVEIQTLYAELLERLSYLEVGRSTGSGFRLIISRA